MVRMIDLPPTKREAMERYPTPEFDTEAWVGGAPIAQRTVTLISSAGLIKRGDRPVTPRDARYRVIPHHLPAEQILMSHVSVNFDRTGFQRDLNVVLPRDRLDELVASGKIGGVAPEHYSFMGATEAVKLEPAARRLAAKLHAEQVDTALLLPV